MTTVYVKIMRSVRFHRTGSEVEFVDPMELYCSRGCPASVRGEGWVETLTVRFIVGCGSGMES